MNLNALAGFTAAAPAEEPKKKSKGKERETVTLPDLDILAAAKTVEKAVKGLSSQLEKQVKEEVKHLFVCKMSETRSKPETLEGRGQRFVCRISPAKKSSLSKLPHETVGLLTRKGVRFEKQVKVEERLTINPDLDQETIQIMAEALQNEPRLAGKNIFIPQPEVSHFSASASTLDDAARKLTREELEEVFSDLANITMGRWQLDGVQDSAAIVRESMKLLGDTGLL